MYIRTCTHSGMLVAKNETLPFVTTRVDLEGIMQSEVSQREKDQSCMISLLEQFSSFFFWLHHMVCGILVSQPGIEPWAPSSESVEP